MKNFFSFLAFLMISNISFATGEKCTCQKGKYINYSDKKCECVEQCPAGKNFYPQTGECLKKCPKCSNANKTGECGQCTNCKQCSAETNPNIQPTK